MTARYLIGDTRDRTAELPDHSVDLILTSPPFLALRDYVDVDHPDKHREIGREPDPAQFIDTLLVLTAEWSRVLAPHGSICVELGDTYSGSGGAGGDYNEKGTRSGQPKFSGSAMSYRKGAQRNRDLTAWPLPKSLALVPELYRIGLAYGRNPLTGAESPAGLWRVRNVVRWHRTNPPVGALGDKFRPATSDLVIACKSATRYFDLDAVRREIEPTAVGTGGRERDRQGRGRKTTKSRTSTSAPPLDTWIISSAPYKGQHYATWPPALCDIPIESMCPRRVCTTCGEPSRRITERSYVDVNGQAVDPPQTDMYASETPRATRGRQPRNGGHERCISSPITTGWTDCGHDTWRTGVVLDPFAGSGTTLMVATHHGRNSIGIDFDPRNAHLAQQRVGMFLEVEA